AQRGQQHQPDQESERTSATHHLDHGSPIRMSATTKVEGEQDAKRRLRPVFGQFRKRARRHDRAKGRIVVEGVAGALLDGGRPERAVALDLDVYLRLLLRVVGLVLALPLLLDLL